MKHVIVSTTINPPTEAILRFDSLPGWTLVVAGDRKTPPDYSLKNGIYLGYEDQRKIDQQLSDLIGPDCIQRRNFAFLYAYNQLNADVIATIDDDNIPTDDWGKDLYLHAEADAAVYAVESHCFDPLSVTNYPHLWHRGFPLQLLGQRRASLRRRVRASFAVQAAFWDGDPDVDAICRMEHAPDCSFASDPFPFTSDQVSPFNSQNTFVRREVLPSYFMFPRVGRMDDIWAAYYVQALGHKVVYTRPSVRQVRNVHRLTSDFLNELDGYVDAVTISEHAAAGKPQQLLDCLPLLSRVAFRRYQTLFR